MTEKLEVNNTDLMKPFMVGIAGGSGTGKSTLAYTLRDKYPEKIAILRFDDYQMEDERSVPVFGGFRNWDHPDCIEFEKLLKDLQGLKNGSSIIVRTWGSRENPDYKITGVRLPITIEPKSVILVEGYLVLWHPSVREFLELKIYLEADESTRVKRRNKLQDERYKGYEERVLIPMHNRYLAPTKNYADYIFDTSEGGSKNLIPFVEQLLPISDS